MTDSGAPFFAKTGAASEKSGDPNEPGMRSEGFSFMSGGLGVEAVFARSCSRVRNRPQPSSTVRGEVISVCHWDSSWKRVFHGSASAVFIGPVHES